MDALRRLAAEDGMFELATAFGETEDDEMEVLVSVDLDCLGDGVSGLKFVLGEWEFSVATSELSLLIALGNELKKENS